MSRLVVVSNRVPIAGDRSAQAGGLAVGLREALRGAGGLWFGWSGELGESVSDVPDIVRRRNLTFATVDLPPADHDAYYTGFANSTLWPLLHYRLGLLHFDRVSFEGYQRVNRRFGAVLHALLKPDDIVWVHDYHLIPLGRELRRLGAGQPLGFFLHTPFPVPEVLTALPCHRDLMEGLCSYDLVGLQTERDLRAFRSYVSDEAQGSWAADGTVQAFGRQLMAGAFPIGIDTEHFAGLAETAALSPETQRLVDSLDGRALIIGVDRLDYSKGLSNRMEAMGELLSGWPQFRRRVTYLQIAPLSRGEVAQYRALRREIEMAAARINGKFAEFDWSPIRYLNRSFPRPTLAGFHRAARIGLVTPLRDGMNLVAKEFVAAQPAADPGVLVLSRFAGAAQEMTGALVINPFDSLEIAEAIRTGLTMGLKERVGRWQAMMGVLRANDARRWATNFISTLRTARHRGGGSRRRPAGGTPRPVSGTLRKAV